MNTNKSPELRPVIDPAGFRETDARWWYGDGENSRSVGINLAGMKRVGLALGQLIRETNGNNNIIIGHDFRSCSKPVSQSLCAGLTSAGMVVHDIGMVITPAAYHAQLSLEIPNLAMVTASHNPKGWTGLKISTNPPLTFGSKEMARLRDMVLRDDARTRPGGSYSKIKTVWKSYVDGLATRSKLKRKLRAVIACGNGTASLFAPIILRNLGVDVTEMDCDLDAGFPNYQPNPESFAMLDAMVAKQKSTGADIVFGFDGDGDRLGVIDNQGNVVPADKLGLLLARDISTQFSDAKFVVDIKSTSLFESDAVLHENGAKVDYYKTGHSHIKQRMREIGAIAGFEKSGHFYFTQPLGNGYDDAMLAAVMVCELLDRNPGCKLSDLIAELPLSYGGLPQHIDCPDAHKYRLVESVSSALEEIFATGRQFSGRLITACNQINGIRITLADGGWALLRASSNGPYLVVVGESLVSQIRNDETIKCLAQIVKKELKQC